MISTALIRLFSRNRLKWIKTVSSRTTEPQDSRDRFESGCVPVYPEISDQEGFSLSRNINQNVKYFLININNIILKFSNSSYGVVVSHSLYTGKAIGSNPVGSTFLPNLKEKVKSNLLVIICSN
jgi:hypothetical protein